MEKKVQDYQDALRAHKDAQQECEGFAEIVRRVGRLMKNWERVAFMNTSHGYPMELAMDFGNSIDADKWPNAEQLAGALARYHSTKQAVSQARAAVSAGYVRRPYPNRRSPWASRYSWSEQACSSTHWRWPFDSPSCLKKPQKQGIDSLGKKFEIVRQGCLKLSAAVEFGLL